ncbi:hypothetical protein [Nonomuraea rubra]|uniref:hypothetical protein n=1 Tax=Nonomuraea rubra TaxID=46180 RepID=UPI0033C59FDC
MPIRRTVLRTEIHDLGHICLYREDLQAITKAVGELGQLSIVGEGFTLDTPEDFDQLADEDKDERIASLVISAKKSNSSTQIEVELSPRLSRITVTEPDITAAGICANIQGICRARLRRMSRRPSTKATSRRKISAPAWLIALIALLATPVALYMTLGQHQLTSTQLFWVTASCASLGVIIGAVVGSNALFRRSAILINALQADRPTFLKRKRDDIWIAIVSFLAGVVVTLVVTLMTAK